MQGLISLQFITKFKVIVHLIPNVIIQQSVDQNAVQFILDDNLWLVEVEWEWLVMHFNQMSFVQLHAWETQKVLKISNALQN